MTQNDTVLLHLQRGHALTSMTAFQLWAITRLSGRILELRKLGYDISTTMEGRGRTRWAVYRLSHAQQRAAA